MTADPDLYLASASPRRRALLEQIGVTFTVLGIEVDESRRAGEGPVDYVSRLALAKARAGRALLEAADPRPVLGADTAVVVDGQILGKPRDRDDALAMLARLSGRTHQVASAVALAGADAEVRVSISRVRFRALSAAERAAYWETGEPRDKAGAYAIQGRAAGFIERLEGSYSGVMGLPLFETVELFKKYKINIL